MPVAWRIRGAVICISIKIRANNDLRRALVEAMSSPSFPHHPALLLDTRTEENATPDQLRRRAGWIATLLSHSSRCSLVVGRRPHQFGLGRMLSVFLGTEGVQAEVFTTIKEGRRWLTPKVRHA